MAEELCPILSFSFLFFSALLMASGANSFFFILGFAWFIQACMAGQIGIRSRLFASDHNQVWLSDNRTFAFGFSPLSSSGDNVNDRFLLAIWFAELPGDRTVIWSANRLVVTNIVEALLFSLYLCVVFFVNFCFFKS